MNRMGLSGGGGQGKLMRDEMKDTTLNYSRDIRYELYVSEFI
jgi:hypothetical protein